MWIWLGSVWGVSLVLVVTFYWRAVRRHRESGGK